MLLMLVLTVVTLAAMSVMWSAPGWLVGRVRSRWHPLKPLWITATRGRRWLLWTAASVVTLVLFGLHRPGTVSAGLFTAVVAQYGAYALASAKAARRRAERATLSARFWAPSRNDGYVDVVGYPGPAPQPYAPRPYGAQPNYPALMPRDATAWWETTISNGDQLS